MHADGEIWVETLWDLRRALVAKHPSDGVTRARALITDGMRLSPDEPSFLQGRDAILKANDARGYGDRDLIWSVFAARGMGVSATSAGGGDTAPRESFAAPAVTSPVVTAKPPPGTGRWPRRATSPRRGCPTSGSRAGASAWDRAARPGPRGVAVGTRFRFRLSERADVRIVLSRALSGPQGEGALPPAHACAPQAPALHTLGGVRAPRSLRPARRPRPGCASAAAWPGTRCPRGATGRS